ncbi:hypothetical protein WICPIJ_005735 [Wickerhamomyces pijperi]|uniref:DNA replication complex GINS protein PSF1 n=1 Tax=Wickerhamomyces pijperi TaxID=599730 RepID=A0A9P8TLI3_WICPI|nr:hypothetical protein WICPIJ_005735 [Wickerhamomyces pijperi]
MYGDGGIKLINEAKRTQHLEILPRFQDEMVRHIINETKELQVIASETSAEPLHNPDPSDQQQTQEDRRQKCLQFISKLAMRRNKRCLLAYERLRSEKMDHMAWNNIEAPIQNHHEEEYLREYESNLINFKSAFIDLDLTGPLVPPKDIFIEVRGLQNVGLIQTEYGAFDVTESSRFFARSTDVERLIQQGYLEKI